MVIVVGLFGVVGVGQCWVVDGLAHLGLVRGLQQPQVVDAGGFHRRGGVRFHRGVHVAADGVRDGSAHGPALVFDLDDGQVERVNSRSMVRPTNAGSTW